MAQDRGGTACASSSAPPPCLRGTGVLGLAGALLGYLIPTSGLGIGDSDFRDFGGSIGAMIGVVIGLPFVGVDTRVKRRSRPD